MTKGEEDTWQERVKKTVWKRKLLLTIGSDGSVEIESGIEDATIELHHDCIDDYLKETFGHYAPACDKIKEICQNYIDAVERTNKELDNAQGDT